MHIRRKGKLAAALDPPAPFPSPIPTGRGLRSSAVDDRVLSEYLEKSLHVPDLSLPGSSYNLNPLIPEKVDLPSLVSRDEVSVSRVLRSAEEYGVFGIGGHGIAVEELRSAVVEAVSVFRNLAERYETEDDDLVVEEIVWFGSEKAMKVGMAEHILGSVAYRSFSQKIKAVGSKLKAISEELAQIFSENVKENSRTRIIQERESILSLYRYSQNWSSDRESVSKYKTDHGHDHDHALTLHLPLDKCEFRAEATQVMPDHTLSFHTGPDTLTVTVGKELEEWSMGEFKSVFGELIFNLEVNPSETTFSVQLKSSPLNKKHGFKGMIKKISITDQILIVFVVAFLYKFIMIIFSRMTG